MSTRPEGSRREPDPSVIPCKSPGCNANEGQVCGYDRATGEEWFHVRRTVEAYNKERAAE